MTGDDRQQAAAAPRASALSHLLVWLAVPAGEWIVGRAVEPSPAAWQWAAEFAAFAALGLLQWRLATEAWLRTLLWPALLVVLTGLAVAGPTGRFTWIVFYSAGVLLLTTQILRDLSAKVRVPVFLGLLLALIAPVANRALDLDTMAGMVAGSFGGMSGSMDQLLFELKGAPDAAPVAGPGGPSIVVISVDTLRADAAPAMESYRRLAARGTAWPVVVSSSSWTMPSVASMQTGLPVAEHGADCVESHGCQGLYPSVRTLAEELSAAGYRTMAFAANPWISRSTGLARGFQVFRDLAGVPPLRLTLAGPAAGPPPSDSKVVIDQAIAALDRERASSIYLWVHLIGPHMPYAHSADPQMQAVTGESLRAGGITGPEFRAEVREAYDGEVAYTDREVGRLLDALEAKGILGSGVVVLTSDHGEEFWEHGGVEHGHTLHREVSEVPLVIAGPGFAAGEKREGVASLVDVAPTLRAAAGLPAGGLDLHGTLPADRVANSFGALYGGTLRGARDAGERVIASRLGIDGEKWERFDLTADPGEQRSLDVVPDSRATKATRAIQGPAPGVAASVNREALRALGYAQ